MERYSVTRRRWYLFRGRYQSHHRAFNSSVDFDPIEHTARTQHRDVIIHNVVDYHGFMSNTILANFVSDFNRYNNQIRPLIYRISFNILVNHPNIYRDYLQEMPFVQFKGVENLDIQHRIRWRKSKRRLFNPNWPTRVIGTIEFKVAFKDATPDHYGMIFDNTGFHPNEAMLLTASYRHLN